MKKIIITGPTGAIGRALVSSAVNAGYKVLAIVHRNSNRISELKSIKNCQVLHLNLNEYHSGLDEISKNGFDTTGYDYFFHLAWMSSFGNGRDDLHLQLKNVSFSLEAVELAKELGCSAFIGAGSQAEYGRTTQKLSPETPAFPETGYGTAKLCAGQMTRLACEQSNLRHIWCRILSVYGPYDREQTLISTAIRKMQRDEETEFTPCEQMWDYVYSDDAAKAILTAAEKGEHGNNFVIGSGEIHPLHEYIETIAKLTGYTKKIGFGKRPYNDKQVMFLQADIDNLKQIGFSPKISFEEGIKETIRWQNNKQKESDQFKDISY